MADLKVNSKKRLRLGSPVIAYLLVILLFMGFVPIGETLWSVRLFAQGSVAVRDGEPGGTSIEASKSAQGFWILTVNRSVDGEDEFENGEGGSEAIPDELSAASATGSEPAGDAGAGMDSGRSAKPPVGPWPDPDKKASIFGVRGEICIQNVGDSVTEDLRILDQVEFKPTGKGKFQPLEGATWEYDPPPLEPGEEACYSYEIVFNQQEGAKAYRNVAHVTITNQAGHMGEPFGPVVRAGFEFPCVPTKIIEETSSGETLSSQPVPIPLIEETITPTVTPTPASTGEESAIPPEDTPTPLETGTPGTSSSTIEPLETPTATPTLESSPTPTASQQPESPSETASDPTSTPTQSASSELQGFALAIQATITDSLDPTRTVVWTTLKPTGWTTASIRRM